jgi:hypothetical protein
MNPFQILYEYMYIYMYICLDSSNISFTINLPVHQLMNGQIIHIQYIILFHSFITIFIEIFEFNSINEFHIHLQRMTIKLLFSFK